MENTCARTGAPHAGLVMMLLSPVSARWDSRIALATGLVVIAGGHCFGLLVDAVWQVMLFSITTGAGVGIARSTMPRRLPAVFDHAGGSECTGDGHSRVAPPG